MILSFSNRNDVVSKLAEMYGAGSFYSKHFSDQPAGEIFFHKKTGFSIGAFHDRGTGYVEEEPTGLQASYLVKK